MTKAAGYTFKITTYHGQWQIIRRLGHEMKKIILGAFAVAIAAGTLSTAPLAQAEPEPDPLPIPFPIPFPRPVDEPRYGPDEVGLGVKSVPSVRSAYSIPPSNPTA